MFINVSGPWVYQDEVVIFCDAGYMLPNSGGETNQTLTCNTDLMWQPQIPNTGCIREYLFIGLFMAYIDQNVKENLFLKCYYQNVLVMSFMNICIA